MNVTVLTIYLVLSTCNTWTGVCEPDVKQEWTVGVPEWGTPTQTLRAAIEKCRVRGVDQAHKLTGIADPFGENHTTTNVDCKWEIGQGV